MGTRWTSPEKNSNGSDEQNDIKTSLKYRKKKKKPHKSKHSGQSDTDTESEWLLEEWGQENEHGSTSSLEQQSPQQQRCEDEKENVPITKPPKPIITEPTDIIEPIASCSFNENFQKKRLLQPETIKTRDLYTSKQRKFTGAEKLQVLEEEKQADLDNEIQNDLEKQMDLEEKKQNGVTKTNLTDFEKSNEKQLETNVGDSKHQMAFDAWYSGDSYMTEFGKYQEIEKQPEITLRKTKSEEIIPCPEEDWYPEEHELADFSFLEEEEPELESDLGIYKLEEPVAQACALNKGENFPPKWYQEHCDYKDRDELEKEMQWGSKSEKQPTPQDMGFWDFPELPPVSGQVYAYGGDLGIAKIITPESSSNSSVRENLTELTPMDPTTSFAAWYRNLDGEYRIPKHDQKQERGKKKQSNKSSPKPYTSTSTWDYSKPYTSTSVWDYSKPCTSTSAQDNSKPCTSTSAKDNPKPCTSTSGWDYSKPCTSTSIKDSSKPCTSASAWDYSKPCTSTSTKDNSKPCTSTSNKENLCFPRKPDLKVDGNRDQLSQITSYPETSSPSNKDNLCFPRKPDLKVEGNRDQLLQITSYPETSSPSNKDNLCFPRKPDLKVDSNRDQLLQITSDPEKTDSESPPETKERPWWHYMETLDTDIEESTNITPRETTERVPPTFTPTFPDYGFVNKEAILLPSGETLHEHGLRTGAIPKRFAKEAYKIATEKCEKRKKSYSASRPTKKIITDKSKENKNQKGNKDS